MSKEIMENKEPQTESLDVKPNISTPRSKSPMQSVVDLLNAERSKHIKTIRHLTAQKDGVDRALDKAEAKLAAIDEALSAVPTEGGP